MDGIHDLGGLQGLGAVDVEPDEPVFHEDWERRAFRVTMAVNGGLHVGGPTFRHSIERMDPAHYLGSTYYEHWLTGVATLAVEAGVVAAEHLERRAGGAYPLARPARSGPALAGGGDRTIAQFAVGDRVRVREWHPPGHTRAPRYVQGKRGVIDRIDELVTFPDDEAVGVIVRDPAYSVRFASTELWGDGGNPGETVNVDLYERYLETTGE